MRRIGRKIVVAVGGTTILAIGVALLVLPGPGLVFIAGGLALLGTEFPAARRLLDRALDAVMSRFRRR